MDLAERSSISLFGCHVAEASSLDRESCQLES
jgi:hypothetical protein